MRLICGFLHLDDQTAAASRLEQMVAALIEPGLSPRIARYIDGPVALAVVDFTQRLETLPQSNSGMMLAADVQIHAPQGDSETLLLHALEGPTLEALGQLIGDFAAAAWDKQTDALLCTRDGLGVRPFFFTHQPGHVFAFASMPSALHYANWVPNALDSHYLMAEMAARFYGPERSLFQGIERLAPGEWLRVTPRGIERRQHWQLDRPLGGQHHCTPQQAADTLATLLEEAVRCRLPPTGPVAAHLSGGLDSSALAIIAARQLEEQQRTLLGYSFLPVSPPGVDLKGEGPYVEAALGLVPNIQWRAIHIEDPAAYLMPKMAEGQAMPRDASLPDLQVCADAARQGASVILSGWGGDEGATFNGRGVLADAFRRGRWCYLLGELRAAARTRGLSPLRMVRAELLPYLMPDAVYRLLKGWRTRHAPHAVTVGSLISLEHRPQLAPMALTANALDNRWQLLTSPHLAKRCETWAMMGAQYGVAFAFPMLDRRVVEFVWSLPNQLFVRGGWKRRVFRDAMAQVLPDAIRWRQNKLTPFPEILLLQAQQRHALLAHVQALAEHPRVAQLFDVAAIEKRIAQLPSVEQARCLIIAEDHQRMAATQAGIPLKVLQTMAYVQQHH